MGQWIVKKRYDRFWLVVYCVVGMAIVMGAMLFVGTR
jgi:hypothetical protein